MSTNDYVVRYETLVYRIKQSLNKMILVKIFLLFIMAFLAFLLFNSNKQSPKNVLTSIAYSNESNVKVNIKTCFSGDIIRKEEPLEDYIVGVLYAELSPNTKMSEEYIKAFIIFARTYTLKRGGYAKGNTLSIKSCSSDQNWCDPKTGCYREQTVKMFNDCIKFSLNKNSKKPYYSAQTCANRVTTFPGLKTVSNKKFKVTNSAWPSGYAKEATSTTMRSKWKGVASDSYLKYLEDLVKSTEGLVIKSNGKIVTVGYNLCQKYSTGHTMCMNKAKELGNKGYTTEQIIKEFTKDYKSIKIEHY